jgi:hypothetical protein
MLYCPLTTPTLDAEIPFMTFAFRSFAFTAYFGWWPVGSDGNAAI